MIRIISPQFVFYCFPITGYPKNHCFSNHLLDFTVQEFDDIYNREITKIYEKYEIKRLSSKRKDIEKECMEQVDLSN